MKLNYTQSKCLAQRRTSYTVFDKYFQAELCLPEAEEGGQERSAMDQIVMFEGQGSIGEVNNDHIQQVLVREIQSLSLSPHTDNKIDTNTPYKHSTQGRLENDFKKKPESSYQETTINCPEEDGKQKVKEINLSEPDGLPAPEGLVKWNPEDIRVEDSIETFKEFGDVMRLVKECCFQEGRLKGLMNGNYLIKANTGGRYYDSDHFVKECSNKLIKWHEYLGSMKLRTEQKSERENTSTNHNVRKELEKICFPSITVVNAMLPKTTNHR
ncbi:unnamed protein product [Lepeophtheirus salmonis]|uniref:(salmon louse) hypothetical protein n=1 Tax=Lepeophtheirus salmonis TaxID=72036 RepID=A0A7R8CXB8_LEPSM|nr:unnamed protein product [Lepeophtheirus salmonis]CAF2913771.1 unnamed protein product [Lepeophtheirus salmonis]